MNQTTATAEAINVTFRKFCNSLSVDLKAQMNGRLERGLQIALTGGVTKYDDPHSSISTRLYKVVSSNPTNPPYLVDLGKRSCTCPDHWKGHFCKHRVAAQVVELAMAQSHDQEATKTVPTEHRNVKSTSCEPLIWACVRLNGKTIGVEVVGIENELVRIQALPAVNTEGKLEPQFPFHNGSFNTLVDISDLFHFRIFQNG